jgi:uncharacterized protein (TIGR02722 family)
MKLVKYLFLATVLVYFYGCGGSSKTVERIDEKSVTDISGRWNDTDSRLTAEEMVKDVLSRPWLTEYTVKNNKKPVVIVGTIRNKSSEHIPVDIFIKDIEREVINSGKVSFVASKEEREEIREERADQQEFSSEETFKRLRNETGADYMLTGVISSITDSAEGQRTIYYSVDLELIELESNVKAWLGNKKIKKLINQDGTGW